MRASHASAWMTTPLLPRGQSQRVAACRPHAVPQPDGTNPADTERPFQDQQSNVCPAGRPKARALVADSKSGPHLLVACAELHAACPRGGGMLRCRAPACTLASTRHRSVFVVLFLVLLLLNSHVTDLSPEQTAVVQQHPTSDWRSSWASTLGICRPSLFGRCILHLAMDGSRAHSSGSPH